ncbi:MAG TPA: beta-ketoacyl-ACP synthase II [Chloroflexi bacterium]|jgi:3-oxoacyl-[acyl-carrier-protein] synthase II|nr:beta-ketoacyl-ACP synthase II [Chloroflexota bacterium]
MRKRVVITGMGTVSPVGNDVPVTWNAVVNGCSGVAPITRFDTKDFRSTIAAEVKNFNPKDHFAPKDARRMDPFVQYALVAAREAVRDAGLEFSNGLGERTAVIIGSGIGGISTTTEQTLTLAERGPARVSPFLIPMILPETAASMVAIEFGLKGPNMAVTSACATGANAIGEAAEMIRRGVADAAVCGGTEAGIVPIAVAGFSVMRALSERNDEPERASRPFDSGRDGFVIGEGSGILVLESLEHALARGAHIYAELAGYGSTDDAFHITAPEENGAGAMACMRQAIEDAGLTVEQIDYINAHGTSTPLNDATETRAIKGVLGDHAMRVPVSSTKSMTGHLLGAAGALEAILSVKTIETGIVLPTINLDDPDPECDLDYVPHTARKVEVNTVLSNSFGFGGHNVCLVFRKIEED